MDHYPNLSTTDASDETVEPICLTPEDLLAFFTALDNPPEPTDALKKAFQRYTARSCVK